MIDIDDDSEDVVIIGEKVNNSNKGKTIDAIHDDHQVVVCIRFVFWFSGMSWNFTNCLMMGAKHLTRTKERSHVIKQRSPDEIRV